MSLMMIRIRWYFRHAHALHISPITEGVRNISNQLTITTKYDLSSANLVEKATEAGLYKKEDGAFNFAKAFDQDGFTTQTSRYCEGKKLLEKFSAEGLYFMILTFIFLRFNPLKLRPWEFKSIQFKSVCFSYPCLLEISLLIRTLEIQTLIPYLLNFKFVRVSSLVGRYFYNVYMYIVKKFEIVFSFNVKGNNILPCFSNIRRSYNRMCMST